MPEPEATQVEDTTGVGAQDAGKEAGDAEAQPKLIFEKFKDIVEAERAYKESERKITEQGKLLSDREKQLQDLGEKAKLADVLKGLAEVRKADVPAGDEEFQKFRDSLSAEMAENPTEATKKLVHLANAWVLDSEKKSQKYSDERATRLEAKLEEMRDLFERQDPIYQKNKDIVDELIAGGMKLGAAKKFVEKLEGNPDVIRRPDPPLTVSSGRTVQTRSEVVFLTPKDKERMRAEGADDKMIAEIEAEYRRNYATEQEMAKRVREG